MTKGQKAGDGPIAVEVEQDKSYYWCGHSIKFFMWTFKKTTILRWIT